MRPLCRNSTRSETSRAKRHLVRDDDHRRAVARRARASRRAPRRSARGRARRSARRTASPWAASPARARWPRAAAARPTAAPDTRSALSDEMHARAGIPAPSSPASLRGMPRTRIGASMTLPSTVMCGQRLNCWNTMPRSRRIRLISASGRGLRCPLAVDCEMPIGSPSMKISPALGVSRWLMQRRSVLLPEPLAPIMLTTAAAVARRRTRPSAPRASRSSCARRRR